MTDAPIDIILNDRIAKSIAPRLDKIAKNSTRAHRELKKLQGLLKRPKRSPFDRDIKKLREAEKAAKRYRQALRGTGFGGGGGGRGRRGGRGSTGVFVSQRRDVLGLTSAMGGLVTAYGAYRVAAATVDRADAFTNIQNRLRNVTDTQEQLNQRTDDLFGIANRARVPVEDLAKSYQRFELAIRAVGGSSRDALTVTERVSKLLTLQGATAGESASAMLQLSQAFNKGKLDGDEFRSVMELMPRAVDAFARQLGVTRGELFDLSREGRITSEVMTDAFLSLNDIDASFDATEKTASQSMTQIRNEFTELAGALRTQDFTVTGLDFLRRGLEGATFTARELRKVIDGYGDSAADVPALSDSLVVDRFLSGQGTGSLADRFQEALAAQRRLNDAQSRSYDLLRNYNQEYIDLVQNAGAGEASERAAASLERINQAFERQRRDADQSATRALFSPEAFRPGVLESAGNAIDAQLAKLRGIRDAIRNANEGTSINLDEALLRRGLQFELNKLKELIAERDKKAAQIRDEATLSRNSAQSIISGLEFENRALRLNGDARQRLIRLRGIALRLEGGTPEDLRRINDLLRENDAIRTQSSLLERIRGPQLEFQRGKTDLKALLDSGRISLGEYNSELERLQSNLDGASRGSRSAGSVVAGSSRRGGLSVDDAVGLNRDFFPSRLGGFSRPFELGLGGINDQFSEVNRSAQLFNSNLAGATAGATQMFGAVGKGLSSVSQQIGQRRPLLGFLLGIFGSALTEIGAQRSRAFSGFGAAALSGGLPRTGLGGGFGGGFGLPGFMTGGFTGDGPANRVAGFVHAGEMVINAQQTARNRALLEQINNGAVPRAASSSAPVVNVRIDNQAPVAVEAVQDGDELVVMIREQIARETPRIVEGQLSKPNSRVSKAVGRNTNARRRR